MTLTVGSRVMLVGRWQVQRVKAVNDVGARQLAVAEGIVNLSHPVMFDGREYWVDGKGLAKALGMKVQRSGRTLTFVP